MGLFNELFPLFELHKEAELSAADRAWLERDFRIVYQGIPHELGELCCELCEEGKNWWGVVAEIPGFNSKVYDYAGNRDAVAHRLRLALPTVPRCDVYVLPDNRILAAACLPGGMGGPEFAAVLCGKLRPRTVEGGAVTKVYDLSQQRDMFVKICAGIQASLREREQALLEKDTFDVRELTEFTLNENQKTKRRKRGELNTLIVEDDPTTLALLMHLVSDQSQAVSAVDAVSAVRHYRQVVPDLVFLDIGLPDMNGLELLKKIKDGDNGACVVMLTADACRQNLDMATRWGAQGFIAKPFRHERLNYYMTLAARLKAGHHPAADAHAR